MLAIDTNVVVRFVTDDHPRQSPRARALITQNEVFVGLTVLLETEWVLRSGYRYMPAEFIAAVRGLAGLPKVSLEHPVAVAQALEWTGQGMDFADALHLAASTGCEAFVTFDEDLVKVSRRVGGPPMRSP